MKKISIIKSLLFVSLLIAFTNLNAKIRPDKSSTITGATGVTNLIVGQKFKSSVDLISSALYSNGNYNSSTNFSSLPINNFHIVSSVGRIKLKVNDNKNACLPKQFSFSVTLKFMKYNTLGNYENFVTKTLTVEYNRSAGNNYKQMDVFQLNDVLYLGCEIISISNSALVDFVSLDCETEVDCIRKDDFLATLFSPSNTSPIFDYGLTKLTTPCGSNSIEINYGVVNTDFKDWTDFIEIQWVFADDEQSITTSYLGGNSIGEVNFNEGISVVIPLYADPTKNKYLLSNIYDKGIVFVRIRAIGKLVKIESGSIIKIETVESNWSIDNNLIYLNQAIANPAYPQTSTNRFLENFNWQYNCMYAEDGKKKEVISYFDGGYKNRQAITESNTNGLKYSVVKETIYDFEGRPAIEVLPVPMENCDLSYVKNLNRNQSDKPYSAQDFDFNEDDCKVATSSMNNNNSGAAKYYSSNNSWLTNNNLSNMNQYIPTSGSNGNYFPFVQTEYMPDNTGRISKITQPGEVFKLESNKETQYYYGKPSQPEIDRLFGEEIGYSSHYTKEMAKDANGQISISFKNASGQVIATSLAGNPTSSLEPLGSATQLADIEDDLLSNGTISIPNGFLLSGQILVEKLAEYKFNYELVPETYKALCGTTEKYCLDCAYDIEISLTDNCGREQFPNSMSFKKTIGPTNTESDFNETCNTSSFSFNSANESISTNGYITVNLAPGEYTIKRKIVINEKALDEYKNRSFDKAACKTLADFEAEQLEKKNLVGCEICNTYNEYKSFVPNTTTHKSLVDEYADAKILNFPEITISAEINAKKEIFRQEFTSMMEEAAKFCNGGSPCDAYKAVLLADLTPGGLYGEINNTKTPSHYNKSVFNIGLTSVTNELPFSYKDINYFKITKSGIWNPTHTSEMYLADLSPTQLISVWKDKFAEELLVLHPEYYQYANCLKYKESMETDQLIANTETYDLASVRGYLTTTIGNNSLFKDNFFNYSTTIVNSSDQTYLDDGLNSNVIEKLTGAAPTSTSFPGITRDLSIKELAAYIVLCKDATDKMACIADKLTNISSCDVTVQNLFWNTYKALYVAIKNKLYERLNTATKASTTPYYTSSTCSLNYNAMYSNIITGNERFNQSLTNRNSSNTNIIDPTYAIKDCQTRCESYADVWIAKLSGCNFSTIATEKKDQIDVLRSTLISVCTEGCDIKSPLGASSVRPSSTNIDKNFNDVLVRLRYNINDNCNSSLIKFPPAYGQPYIIDNDNSISSCGTPLKPFLFRQGCPISVGCSNENNDLGTMLKIIDTYIPKPCDNNQVCRSCEDIRRAYNNFYQINEKEETDSDFESSFIDYMNKELDMDITFSSYINTMKSCLGYSTSIASGINTTIKILKEFRYTYLIHKFDMYGNLQASLIKNNQEIDFKNKININNDKQYSKNIWTFNIAEKYKNYYNTSKQKTENYLLASLNENTFIAEPKPLGFERLSFTPAVKALETQVKVLPCACRKLQELKDAYDAMGAAKPASFGAYLTNEGYDSPDAEEVLAACKQAFEDPQSDDQEPARTIIPFDRNSSFNGAQEEILRGFVGEMGYTVSSLLCNPIPAEPIPQPEDSIDHPVGTGLGGNPIDPVTTAREDGCTIFKNQLASLMVIDNFNVLDYLDENASGNTNFAKLIALYNSIVPSLNSNGNFIVLSDPNPIFVMEWFKRKLCECRINNELCGGGNNAFETAPCPPVVTTNSTCSKCFVPDNKLLDIMKILNKVCKIQTAVRLTTKCTNISYNTNGLIKENFLMNPRIPEYCNNTLFYSITPNHPNTIRYKGSFSGNGSTQFLGVTIVDDGSHIDYLALSFNKMSDNYSMAFIKKIISIRPFYISNTCGSTRHFIVEAIMTLNDRKNCTSNEVIVTLTGTYNTAITREANCDIKDIRICKTTPLPCERLQTNIAKNNARIAYDNYIIKLMKDEEIKYIQKCLSAIPTNEKFKVKYPSNQYHFTLYYYDMVGNLISTVPPKGVNPLNFTQTENINIKRGNAASTVTIVNPAHQLKTIYTYNTLNQLVKQQTPDAGMSEFWYDKVGRLVLSQNSKQEANHSSNNNYYSYTIFDLIGRINEVGELKLNDGPHNSLHDQSDGQFALETTGFIKDNILDNTFKTEITKTYYDNYSGTNYVLNNLRTRVAKVAYFSNYYINSGVEIKPDHAVMYSYDASGNVTQMIRYIKGLEVLNQQDKKVDYQFDLISGKVESVLYQSQQADQYIHHYKYDAENKLIESYSSPRAELIDYYDIYDKRGLDANYNYYLHGPLARTEIGELKVQGIDYAYTLQGWLKGVNSIALKTQTDMGKDGYAIDGTSPSGTVNSNTNVAKDEFGYVLNYFDGDYQQIQQKIPNNPTINYYPSWLFNGTFDPNNISVLANNQKNLYNGNISQMITAIGKLMPDNKPLASTYQYDQLNRIISAKYLDNFVPSTNSWATTGNLLTNWQNSFTYDANGNILTQNRNGSGTTTAMDNLQYNYISNTNQLAYVEDNTANTNNYPDDIDDQKASTISLGINNYKYDKIGNLIYDRAEEIASIEWNLYGKIKKITRTSGSTKPNLEFEYTPDGHRSVKIVIPKNTSLPKIYTYYMRDAQGNIMATYEREFLKTVDFESLSYADVNSEIITNVGNNGFASYIADRHQGNSAVKTALENNLIANGGKRDEFLNNSDLPSLLTDINNFNSTKAVIASYDDWDFLNTISSSYGMSNLIILEQNMNLRFLANNSFNNLQNTIVNNNTTLTELFFKLNQMNIMEYNNVLFNLSITPTNFGSDMTDLNNYVSMNGTSNLLISLDAEIGFNNLSSGIAYPIVFDLINNNPAFRNVLLSNIPEFKELFFVSGDGSLSYAGNQLGLAIIIDDLNTYNASGLQSRTRAYFDGGEDAMVNWYKNNQLYSFVYYATLADNAEVTSYQTSNTGLYKPSGAPSTSNGISFYFNEIKTYFGQSLTDQLLNDFLASSNLYIDKLVVKEWHIYGSSRLGIYKANVLVASKTVHITEGTGNAAPSEYSSNELSPLITPVLDYNNFSQTRGAKHYELSNHLGNVLVVITDKKTNCINPEAYAADFKTGVGNFTGGWSTYTNGIYTIVEAEQSTVANDNGRLKTNATVTYGGNRCVINTENGKSYTFTFDLDLATTPNLNVSARTTNGSNIYNGTNLAQMYVDANGTYTLTFTATTTTTQLLFEKTAYGATYFYIDNAKVEETNATPYNYFVADVVTANDYSPFGAPLAGRSYTASNSDYRFGFNGKEKDDEVNGEGNSYDFGARIYDSRLGRWLSLDPLQAKYPSLSPYNYVANSPIWLIDPDGKVIALYTKAERRAWKELKAELKKTEAGRQTMNTLKASEEVFHITLTNSVLIDFNGRNGSFGIAEGVYVNGALSSNFNDGKNHSRLIISKGTWVLKDNIKCSTGLDINLVNRQNSTEVQNANNVINAEVATGNYTFVDYNLNAVPQSSVSTQNLLVRSSAGVGHLGKDGQWNNAPAWNWNSNLEKATKPLANESLQEFLGRVGVHEGTHPEVFKKEFSILSPDEKVKWQNNETRFETTPYSKEAVQIYQQKQNRNSKRN